MNVKEFKEWLNQFPDDAEVEVLQHHLGRNWDSDSVNEVTFVGEKFEDWDFTDFTDNPHTKEDSPWFNKRILNLGVKN